MRPDEWRGIAAGMRLTGETEAESARAALRETLAEIDRLRALPVIATCGECGWCSYDMRDDGQRSRWVCRHGNRCVSRGEPPPAWCPLRGGR